MRCKIMLGVVPGGMALGLAACGNDREPGRDRRLMGAGRVPASQPSLRTPGYRCLIAAVSRGGWRGHHA